LYALVLIEKFIFIRTSGVDKEGKH